MPESAPMNPPSVKAMRPEPRRRNADQSRAEPVHRGRAQRLAEQGELEEYA